MRERMRKMRKRIVMLFLALTFALTLPASTAMALTLQPSYTPPPMHTYKVTGVSFVRDEYSNWHRLNSVFKAHRKGETATYEESTSVTVTSSFNLSFPISKVTAELGYSVENSVSSTIRGTTSASLAKGESAAFYYREHWKVYTVYYEDNVTTWDPQRGYTTTGLCYQKEIKVAQKLNEDDYGWFYASKGNQKVLTSELSDSLCDDNYSCKVK